MMTTGIRALPSYNAKFSIIDISPTIHESLAVWPGDTAFHRKENLKIIAGHNIDLSEITTSLHIGAHADSPSHFKAEELGIDELDLSPYLGHCQVVSIDIERGQRIYPQDIKVDIIAPRVLFKSLSYPNPNLFNEDFNALSRELIEFLGEKKCVLVGIDTPSVDLFDDKILESHNALLNYNMRNLEGLVLGDVSAGEYFLSAAPLKIEAADAAPVRALLLDFY